MVKFNPVFITALVAQLCSLCHIFGLKVTLYTMTEIQKTHEAGLFICLFFNHTLEYLVLIPMLKGTAACLQWPGKLKEP